MPSWELPRGRHRIPRDVVVENQRQRLFSGVGQALSEHGYIRLTVEQVIEAAGVSRTTFYQHFDNKRDAVLSAHEAAFERFLVSVVRACNSESDWSLKVRAAIWDALDFAAAEPGQAQLLVLDAIAADAEVARRVLASNDHLAALLSAGRRQSAQAAALPELTEKALIGALTAIVGGRLMNGDVESLPGLAPQLIELVLMPYVGAEEARRVAAEPPPGRPEAPAPR